MGGFKKTLSQRALLEKSPFFMPFVPLMSPFCYPNWPPKKHPLLLGKYIIPLPMKERCLPSPFYSHSPIWYLLPFFLVQNISQWLNVTVCHHSCVRRKVLRQFCLTSPDKWEILVGNYFLGDIHCQDTKGKMVLEIVALSLPFLLVIQQERIKIPS